MTIENLERYIEVSDKILHLVGMWGLSLALVVVVFCGLYILMKMAVECFKDY